MQPIIRNTLVFLAVTALHLASFAQQKGYLVRGSVADAQSGSPVPYATVMLVTNDSLQSLITGTTTDDQGQFRLRTDSIQVFVQISFIGYETMTIRNLYPEGRVVNLGTIDLSQNSESLNEVEITAERSVMEFQLDKRVFNVGKDISSTGMSALDVLNNVPSVNVDIEGQISLRGNTGVQILINGKPSVLSDDGSNALGTITADMIESVEVITNPSAKYEAGGTSGILNIVLKKEEKKGFNGSVSVNTGFPSNHSIGVSLNRRTEKFNLFTQFGGGYRSLPSFKESINENRISGEEIHSDGVEYRNENFYNITLGTDYHVNKWNVITLSGNFALELEDQPSETSFALYEGDLGLTSEWKREETTTAVNPKYQYDLQYEKQFKSHEDHTLQFSTLGSFFGKEQSSEFINTPILGSEIDDNQQTKTTFYRADYIFKLDYTNPITERVTIETGALYNINNVGNDFTVSNLQGGEWIADSGLTNNFEYNQKVLGVYGTGAYEREKWGVKLGLRVENTDLRTVLTTTDERNNQFFTNLFPTFHTSYKISKRFSMQAGYSRRIFRPRLWDLNPFFNIRNNYNIRTGNPALLPEFADSYELTSILTFKKWSLNSSVYHLYTTDVVERVSFFENNVNITTPMNIGTRAKTGLEINGKYTPVKWLTINGDANYGYFVRKGQFESQNFDFAGDQWTSRLTTKFQLPAKFDVELTGNYESGYQTVQARISGFAFLNVGLRKKLWDGKGVINATVRDVFASRIRESIIDREEFYLYDFSQRGRFFTLGFSYSFGKGEAMTYSGRRR